jgi:hypothetical protein
MKASPAPAEGASCEPSGGVPGAWAWDTRMTACTLPLQASTCGQDQVCAKREGAEFGDKFCIFKAGDDECPPGPYSKATHFFGSVDDSRNCDTCSCDSVEERTCGGTIELYSGIECLGPIVFGAPVDGSCQLLSSGLPATSWKYAPDQAKGGSCKVIAAPPFSPGELKPNNPVTVCCMP